MKDRTQSDAMRAVVSSSDGKGAVAASCSARGSMNGPTSVDSSAKSLRGRSMPGSVKTRRRS
eukprot:2495693-Prymnesium_polylepis.1